MPVNPNPLASQRNILNIRTFRTYAYAMIDHFKFSDQSLAPNGSSPATPWGQIIDSQGWPNTSAIRGHGFNGGGLHLPSTDNYTGNYTFDWTGSGEFAFNIGSWTLVSATNATQVGGAGSGHFQSTAGATSGSVTATLSGLANPNGLPNLIALNFLNSDLDSNGNYIRNFRFYRSGDATRLGQGKMFRVPLLQAIVDMNPSAIRFMDWIGGNDDQNCRWENRCKPDHGMYVGDYTASPAYASADYVVGTGTTHQYTLAASSGTAGNPKVTSSVPTHGEVVTTFIATGTARAGTAHISNITNAATPTVTAAGHPFVNGDTVYHSIPTSSGMQQLDRRKCVVSNVVAGVSYDININTSGFAAFSGTATADFYVSLKLGTWNDFPILFTDGFNPPTTGNFNGGSTLYFQPGTYTLWFDKNISPMNDSSSNPIQGAWLFTNSGAGAGTGPQTGMPIELCTQMVLEANELSIAQGINNPIHLWLNMPFRGMLSVDPDYSSASNFAVKMVDVALNGSTVNGVTYAGLKSVNGPSLLLECSNELWNTGGADTQAILSQAYAQAVVGKDNYNETAGYSSWRSVAMVQDVKPAFPSEPRLKYVLASQGTNVGVAQAYMYATGGTTFYTNHKLGGWPTLPLTAHDAFAHAPYVDPWGDFSTAYNSGFADDYSKYTGVDNSAALVITANATTTNTLVTTAVTNGPVVVGQLLCGAGLPNGTWVTAVNGVSPNYTLTLNNGSPLAGRPGVNVPSGAKISSVGLMTCNSSSSSNTLTVTASNVWFDGTPIGNGIRFVGPGVNQPIFRTANGIVYIVGISGTFPNYTLTLNQTVSFSGGTIAISSAAGGDYRGAANQSAAIQSFVDVVRGVTPVDTLDETINRYCNPAAPTAGVEFGYTSDARFAGKTLIHYEGNTNWNGGHPLDAGFDFMLAVNQSSQWATATKDYWNARAGQSGMAMPAIYGWLSGDETTLFMWWSFATPDNYDASHTEGQNLKNTAFWPALGARNQAFNEYGAIAPTPTGGRGTHLKTRLHLH